ncbi:MAG: precorrin-3B C(17)-methyltransferase [Chloroflexota bacterium]
MSGRLTLVSLGPGALGSMTFAARQALESATHIIGYRYYTDLIEPLVQPSQVCIPMAMGTEVERARKSITLAREGSTVALISSGDIGIYAMASPVFEVLEAGGWEGTNPEVVVLPGVSAFQAAAAQLGAAVGHDFCAISLSDLLTPWSIIEKRVEAAASADFVVAFYNPRSQKRDWQLGRAVEILRSQRAADTPTVICRNMTRSDQQMTPTTLGQLQTDAVDMFSLVLVGNSQSRFIGHKYLFTPRGYSITDDKN